MTSNNMQVPEDVKPDLSPIVNSKEFQESPFETACSLLGSSGVLAHDEVEVFLAAVQWLNHDWTNRRDSVVDIMRCVRFGLMDPIELVEILGHTECPVLVEVTNVPEVRVMIWEGLTYATGRYDQLRHWANELGLSGPQTRSYKVEQ